MKIKKFVARDYQTALKQAKQEMGRDAIILHSHQVRRKGLLAFLLPPQVEITVAVDEALKVNTDRRREAVLPPTRPDDLLLSHEQGYTGNNLEEELKKMNALMMEIKTKMNELELIKGMSGQVQEFYHALVANQVDREVALKIATSVESRLPQGSRTDENWAVEVCLHTLGEYVQGVKPIDLTGDKKGKLVFMVGPTGVGKTTTIAKLAANMTFVDRKKVALITLDTYRISAADQLRTFAEIIGIPISVVFTTDEFNAAMEKYQEKDIIFVDTAGRSPYNRQQMEELKQFVTVARPDETLLVLSVTTETSDMVNIYEQFKAIGIDKVVFTKVDETYNYGQILNAIYQIKKPIAYLTTGQNVPDDIEVPDSLHLARMVLGKGEVL